MTSRWLLRKRRVPRSAVPAAPQTYDDRGINLAQAPGRAACASRDLLRGTPRGVGKDRTNFPLTPIRHPHQLPSRLFLLDALIEAPVFKFVMVA
jgi:hypothetical protein